MTRSKFSAWPSLLMLLFISPGQLAADTYKVDPDHTSIVFSVARGSPPSATGKASISRRSDRTVSMPAAVLMQLSIQATVVATAARDSLASGCRSVFIKSEAQGRCSVYCIVPIQETFMASSNLEQRVRALEQEITGEG